MGEHGSLDRALAVTPKTLAFLSGDRAALHGALAGLTGRCRAAHGTVALWEALPAGVLGESPQGQSVAAAHDFVLELTGHAGERLVLDGLRDLHGLDLPRSAIFAGTEYTIVAGGGEASLFCLLARRDHLDPPAFQSYWLDVHADFGRKDPRNGYCQVHPDIDRMAAAAAISGLPASAVDGVAEAYFVDVPFMRERLNAPDIAGEAFADEQRFIDHARSAFLPFGRVDA